MLRMLFYKGRAACGRLILLLTALALAVCFLTVRAVTTGTAAPALRILVTDGDQSALSADLCGQLAARGGLEVLPVSEAEAEQALADGRAEGWLQLPAGFGRALADGETPALSYRAAAGAASAEAVRETVAGQVRTLAALQNALRKAGELSDDERAALEERFWRYADAGQKTLYEATVKGSGGESAALFAGGWAEGAGFALLAGLLCTLAVSHFFHTPPAQAVDRRLSSLPHGLARAFFSGWGLLLFTGLAVSALYFLTGAPLSARAAAAFFAYDLLCAGLAAVLQNLAAWGRADALTPLVVLGTSLVGGCFFNVAAVSPALRTLALFTPQGLALAALHGDGLWPTAALLGLAAGLTALGAARFAHRFRAPAKL